MNKNFTYYLSCTLILFFFYLSLQLYGIYPDEIAHQIISSRFWFDGFNKLSIHPQCNSWVMKIPLIFYPASIILSIFSYIDNLYLFRFLTVLIFFISIFFLFLAFRNLFQIKVNLKFFTIFILLFVAGVKSIGIILFRPELFLFLTITFGLYVISNKKAKIYHYFIFLFLYQISIYMHAFALYFLPLTILVFWKRYFLLLVTFFSTYQMLDIHSLQLLKCNVREIANYNNSLNINPLTFITNFRSNFQLFIENLGLEKFYDIFRRLIYQSSSSDQIGYLPKLPIYKNFYFFIANIILTIVNVLVFSFTFFNLYKFYSKNKFNKVNLYILILVLCTLVHLLLNITNNFYAISFWYFCFLIAFVYFLLHSDNYVKLIQNTYIAILKNKKIKLISTILILSVLISLIDFVIHLASFTGPNLSLRYKNVYSSNYISKVNSFFDENILKKNMVIIDDASYFMLKRKISYPIHINYLKLFNNQKKFITSNEIVYSIAKCSAHSTLVIDHPGYEIDGSYDGNNICFKRLNHRKLYE